LNRFADVIGIRDTARPRAGCARFDNSRQVAEDTMNRPITLGIAMLAGAALGAAAVQGLHAQAKPKAYTVAELETLDVAAQAAYVPAVLAAQKAAGGHPFNTGGGKMIAMEGAVAPMRVAITEWDSLDQAQAFYNSAAWKNLAPQRDKAATTIRRYTVEAVN
jgi:uncharacterized protein (DUF1330 family)